jgi:hypothetical protein
MCTRKLAILVIVVFAVTVGHATPAPFPQVGVLPPGTLPCVPGGSVCTQVDSTANCCEGFFCSTENVVGTAGVSIQLV